MPFGDRSDPYVPGYGFVRKRKKRATKPTSVTVTSNGQVTATGPEAKKAKKQVRRSQKRVKRITGEIAQEERARQEIIGKVIRPGTETTGPLDSVLDAVGDAAEYVKETPDRIIEKKGGPISPFPEGSAADTAIGTFMLASPGGASKAAKTLGSASTAGTTVKTGEKALERVAEAVKSAPRRKVAKVRSAPKRAARRVKETPERVRTAPKRAKRAVKTKEGRRAAAKGARRKVYAHPVGSAAGVSYGVNQTGLDIPGIKQAGAFVEGHVEADPLKTLKTTARAVPGIVTGPAALVGAAGSSVIHGTPEPLKEEASKQAKGLVEMGGKLLSGDPETVQRAVEDEVGYSIVAPLPAVSRLRKTKVYKRGRGKARTKVATRREGTRAKRRSELKDFKTGKRGKKPRKIRHAVKDTATGEERILRRTGKAVEGHRQRKAVSRAAAREKAAGEREALLASKDVVKNIRRSKLAKGDHNVGDVLATVAQYGISRKSNRAQRQLDEIEASIGKAHPDEIPAKTITDLRNIAWIRAHPQMFEDKAFWAAVDAYKKQARRIEHSGRKKVLALSDVYGHARPEERLEAGVKVGGRTVRSNFHKDPATLERKKAELSELRRDAREAAEGAAKARPAERARYSRVAAAIAARAKKLERELKDYRAGFKQAQKDFTREAQATIRNKGYEQPAYVKDVKPRQGLEPLPAFPGGRSARKQHMAGMEQARRGSTIARDFETLVDQSIAEPRIRRAMHRATTNFAEEWAIPVKGKRYLTSEEINRAINRGELDESQYAVLHSQFFKQAILDPHKGGDKFLDAVRGASNRPMREEIAGRANDTGNKYVVVPKEPLAELVHQMEPPKGMDKIFGGANRFLTRIILGYSPGWAVAQLVAEGIPATIAIGANPARWARVAKFLAKEDRQLDDKARAAIDGTVGESAGVTPHPQIQFKPDTNLMATRFFRLSSRNRIGRALLSGAKGDALGKFDRWKGGKYRKAVAAAKADKELNSFVGSLSELMKGQRSIAETIKGKSLKEQMAYIASHPKLAAKMESYLDDVMGNWRALTRHEAKFAPLVVFYPFVRYSLRWMFWSFPKQHPVKASVLYFLAQQNANELEKLIGGKPSNPLDYAFPVYTSEGGTNVLPGGSRIAPGMNAITTSIGKGELESLMTALNPAAGIGISAITGVDPLSGEKKAHNPLDAGLLALNQLLSMPAPARMLDLNDVGQGEQSGVSKAFEKMDPLRDERSAVFPFAPQSGERYADSARLANALDESGFDPELGDDAITRALDAIKRGDTRLAKRLQKRREHSDAASDEIGALVREYIGPEGDLPDLSDNQYEWLGKITGKRVFPYEPPKPNPFGLPDTDSASLREQFGIPETGAAALREQFGIE